MATLVMNAEGVLLAIETSGKSGSVAILYNKQANVVCHMELLAPESGSAKTLAPAIARLLSSHRVDIKSLSAIALLTGPGSFTGLRVGVATAKAMAYALKIPTIEIDTLDAVAMQCPILSESLYTVMDAYRGQVFCAQYAIRDQGTGLRFERISPTEIIDIEILLERANKCGGLGATIDFCGPGCDRIRRFLAAPTENADGFEAEWIQRIRWIDGPGTDPNAESVARLGCTKWMSDDVLDPFLIQPRYYRVSAAEEVRLIKSKVP